MPYCHRLAEPCGILEFDPARCPLTVPLQPLKHQITSPQELFYTPLHPKRRHRPRDQRRHDPRAVVGRVARGDGAGGGDGLRGVEVRRERHDGPMGEQQRGQRKRGRGEEGGAVQQDDRGGREHAEQEDGREAEAVERFALLRGEKDYQDGDGDEEDHKRDHGVVVEEERSEMVWVQWGSTVHFFHCMVTCHHFTTDGERQGLSAARGAQPSAGHQGTRRNGSAASSGSQGS